MRGSTPLSRYLGAVAQQVRFTAVQSALPDAELSVQNGSPPFFPTAH